MNIIEVIPNIYLASFPTQKELTFTMCRVEEFYEAASDRLRGQVFSWAEFIDEFMNDAGELDYFHRWVGFNIPGDVFTQWAVAFTDKSAREQALSDAIMAKISPGVKFYVLAVKDQATDVKDHEIAHALYYINNRYRAEMDALNSSAAGEIKASMVAVLTQLGYSATVHDDELQAYLATSDYTYMYNRFGLTQAQLEHVMPQYKAVFRKYN